MVATLDMDLPGNPGPAGEARSDGVAGQTLTLEATSAGTPTRSLALISAAGDAAPPALVNTSPTTWTFAPNPAGGATYVFELIEDEGLPTQSKVRRTYAIRTTNLERRIPGRMEGADPTASLDNDGAEIVRRSNDNEGGNIWGWAVEGEEWLGDIDAQLGKIRLSDGTILTPQAVADGEFLRRDGTDIVGSADSTVVQNVGAGAGVWRDTVAGTVSLRSLVGVGVISATEVGDTIEIEFTGPSGDVTGAANVGGGAGVFRDEVAGVLNFRSLVGSGDVTVTENADTISIDYTGAAVSDHGALTGLADDDHLQYALLAGRAGGQTLRGGTAAAENLVLQSTAHATRGFVEVQDILRLHNQAWFSIDSLDPRYIIVQQDPTIGVVGGDLVISAQQGGDADNVTPGGEGGELALYGASGGLGTAFQPPGVGGDGIFGGGASVDMGGGGGVGGGDVPFLEGVEVRSLAGAGEDLVLA